MSFKKKAKEEYKRLVDSKYKCLKRGDIVLTNCHGSWMAKLIRLKGFVDSGACHVNHAELYIGSGLDIAAELTINIHPLKKFFLGKHDLYVFRNTSLTQDQRNKLVAESFVYHGRYYDVLGILGQAVEFLTGMKKWSKAINSKKLLYCSELVAKVYKTVLPSFMKGVNYQTITPDNIFDFCTINKKDWQCVYKLVKNPIV